MKGIARHFIQKYGLIESFYIAKISTLQDNISIWKSLLPDITPYYAMKCNPDQEVIKVMLKHGFGIDVASRHELNTALNLGACPSKIIYANPVKLVKDIKYSQLKNVTKTTFDSTFELDKLTDMKVNPLIRLKINNPNARINLNNKYGVAYDDYKSLIQYALKHDINIGGVSFHVGSASKNPEVYKKAIEQSLDVIDYARSCGHSMKILDIGGGFTTSNIKESAYYIKNAILNSRIKDIEYIAEPGRYFVENVFTFFTPIIGKRLSSENRVTEYWIGDGLYGSFNCIIYDGQIPEFQELPVKSYDTTNHPIVPAIIHGQTCDSFDTLKYQVNLPSTLTYGDYLMIKNFGAYTVAGACDFNGLNMSKPKVLYLC